LLTVRQFSIAVVLFATQDRSNAADADAVCLSSVSFWRDRLHQWFGLCIVKAGSCTDPDEKSAILSLADHTFTDLQDGHSEMYVEFLHELGLSDTEIAASERSRATTAYERSFFDDFGYEPTTSTKRWRP
jgi:hypothetical protein